MHHSSGWMIETISLKLSHEPMPMFFLVRRVFMRRFSHPFERSNRSSFLAPAKAESLPRNSLWIFSGPSSDTMTRENSLQFSQIQLIFPGVPTPLVVIVAEIDWAAHSLTKKGKCLYKRGSPPERSIFWTPSFFKSDTYIGTSCRETSLSSHRILRVKHIEQFSEHLLVMCHITWPNDTVFCVVPSNEFVTGLYR